jgi:hypothetical protein
VATLAEPIEAGGDWSCAFRITGLANEVDERVRGVDGMQAIALGMEGLRVCLERAAESLTWEYAEDGYLGFSRYFPAGFGADVEKHLVKLVNDEIARLVAVRALARGQKPPPNQP